VVNDVASCWVNVTRPPAAACTTRHVVPHAHGAFTHRLSAAAGAARAGGAWQLPRRPIPPIAPAAGKPPAAPRPPMGSTADPSNPPELARIESREGFPPRPDPDATSASPANSSSHNTRPAPAPTPGPAAGIGPAAAPAAAACLPFPAAAPPAPRPPLPPAPADLPARPPRFITLEKARLTLGT